MASEAQLDDSEESLRHPDTYKDEFKHGRRDLQEGRQEGSARVVWQKL